MDWEKINNKSIIKLYSLLNLQSLTLEHYHNDPNDQYNSYTYIVDVDGNKVINTFKNKNEKASIIDNNNYNDDFNLYDLLDQKLIKINDLNNWLIGMPNFKEPYTTNNNGFMQNGWIVSYMNFNQYKYQFNKTLSTPNTPTLTTTNITSSTMLKPARILSSNEILRFFPEKIIITKMQKFNQKGFNKKIKIKIIVNNFNLIKI